MAVHRRPGRPRKYSLKRAKEKLGISPEVSKEITSIILVILGILFILSLFGATGSFGDVIAKILKIILGFSAWLLPFFLIGLGVIIWQSIKEETGIKTSIWIGTILFFLSFSGLIHLFVNQFNALDVAKDGGGGGIIGYGVSSLFLKLIEFWGSLFVLIAAFVISVILTFNISFSKISEWWHGKMEEREGEERRSFLSRFRREKQVAPQEPAPKPQLADANWTLPPVELLNDKVTKPASGDVKKNIEVIEKTLNNFNIEVKMAEVNIGPTVTQYCLKPAPSVKLNQITARANDLALSLAAHPIRIEAPIPGRSAVGIEVPNKVPALVRLREMISTPEFNGLKSKLGFILGRDVAGEPMTANLDKMPHLLIAGATGSGKSICINSIILTLLYRNSPQDLRFILVDPKRVELPPYNGVAHLLTPVIVDLDKTVNALKWVVSEMDRRYKVLSESGKKDIETYNKSSSEHLPYLVVIIDELADLMVSAPREVEASIVRMAQMARAVGIHLIVATQRPSVDVITGLIKANITARIAFATASQVDSRTILDMSGAEKLLGNGDMLYLASDVGKPKRIQGVYVSEKEVKSVVDFLKKQGETVYNEEVVEYKSVGDQRVGMGAPDDELFNEAVEVVVKARKASASLLQRRLRVGYARAARLLDLLEEKGIIGPAEGAKPRDVLIDEGGQYRFEDH
ncbi:MAG: DNA translocase FtsK 4TM domain-containing protein [Candidatus Pacebacteria bacterium]|nr:DNA translocase FtsK 4TM domain-containing protein [Candidatus Paceibacterota bacterium]